MNISSEQAEVVELCSMCKFRDTCQDYLMSKRANSRGFSVLIVNCPKFEPEDKE